MNSTEKRYIEDRGARIKEDGTNLIVDCPLEVTRVAIAEIALTLAEACHGNFDGYHVSVLGTEIVRIEVYPD